MVQCTSLAHLNLNYNNKLEQPEQRDLQECWDSTGSWCTSILAGIGSAMLGQRGLRECFGSVQRSFISISTASIKSANVRVERFAGVLAQCPALAHLGLYKNGIGAGGADSLAGVLR